MRRRQRPFSLLEVLIGLALVTIALPLLLAPFFYEATNLEEGRKQLKAAEALNASFAIVLEALHAKKIPLENTPEAEWLQYEKIAYKLKRIRPEEPEKEADVELWQLTLKGLKNNLEYNIVGVKS